MCVFEGKLRLQHTSLGLGFKADSISHTQTVFGIGQLQFSATLAILK